MGHQNTFEGGRDFTASAFIVHLGEGKPKLALHKHTELNTLLQFGGHIEGTETPWDTALRKAATEGGYEAAQLDVLQPFGALPELEGADVHPTPVCANTHLIPSLEVTHYHTDSAFAFTTHEPPRESDANTARIELLTAEELDDLPDIAVPANVRTIGLHVLRVVLLSPEWHSLSAISFESKWSGDGGQHQQ